MGEQTYGKGLIQSLKSLGEDSGIAITVASYLTPNGNNIQGQGMTPDKLLDLPDASDYGSTDDKWVRNAELFLGSLLEKEEVSVQEIELNNENKDPKIKSDLSSVSNVSSQIEQGENENAAKKLSRRKRGFQKREAELSLEENNNDENEINEPDNDKISGDHLPL